MVLRLQNCNSNVLVRKLYMMGFIRNCSFLLILGMGLYACKKDDTAGSGPVTPNGYKLSYGDSVFYLNGPASDYIIEPLQAKTGEYTGFPEGIDIDANTGAINVSKSETGLRYRITFFPDGSTDSFSTDIVVSGINFLDGFYKLTTADSVLRPVYNGNTNSLVPGINSGTIFDEGSGCNSAGCNVNTASGSINLAQTVRNGVFGANPSNNDRHEFELNYRINDKSGKALNTLKVKLYYFNSIDDVTPEAYDIISSRTGAIFNVTPKEIPFEQLIAVNSVAQVNGHTKAVPKPRPPCIFILGR